ncbi:MAG: DUF5317 domain-containing protein [Frankiaceae bacterium]|nr:DUF5317 domain-containing protein [Frankiaceae bacterium]MBV9872741.1 DUF5317 domain-containing protein [Frankiaceae bacterium]
MALAVILLGGAAVLAGLLGGSWANFSALPIRSSRLVAVAVAAQVLGNLLSRLTGLHGFYPAGLALSALTALVFCARNLTVAGVPLITLGLLSNALVVAINGTMPVSIDAAARANISVAAIAAGDDARHEIAGRNTTLRRLGDVIPLPLPVQPEVVSPGDALIAAGIGELVFLGMRGRRRLSQPDAARQEPAAVALS